MKLIIQIPCFNEEETLPETIRDLPKQVKGFDCVEYQIIDDGSHDRTIAVAKELGVHHIVDLKINRGLASGFQAGINHALKQGADVIVNTDGDNQYPGDRIEDLCQPVLRNEADIVIGNRRPREDKHYSTIKKVLHKFGTAVIKRASKTNINDPVSGFRAISREAAIRINITSRFSYTTEMIIQAGHRNMRLAEIDIEANEKTRESRLFKSIGQFVGRSMTTIIRTYVTYRPLHLFTYIGLIPLCIGLYPIAEFLIAYFSGNGDGRIQSLILGSSLIVVAALTFLAGLTADLIGRVRQLQELTLETIRRVELDRQNDLKSQKEER